jgi:hypothetical protein
MIIICLFFAQQIFAKDGDKIKDMESYKEVQESWKNVKVEWQKIRDKTKNYIKNYKEKK